jgi:hypothetical protein
MTLALTPSSFDKGKPAGETIADPARWETRFQEVASICERFLDAYEEVQPVARQRVALWQGLDLFYYVLSGWMKVKVSETAYLVKMLDGFVRQAGWLNFG